MNKPKSDYLIIGSGAGGAALANTLTKLGKNVLVLEQGKFEKDIGTVKGALRFYEYNRVKQPPTSKEGVRLWRGLLAGGSTVLSMGNAMRCLQTELTHCGLDLEQELSEAEHDVGIMPLSEHLLSEGSLTIREKADKMGFSFSPMPKMIDCAQCKACGNCQMGCFYNNKWSALEYLHEAMELGAQVETGVRVTKVNVRAGKATGVQAITSDGLTEYPAEKVFLCAGAMSTPKILQRTGIENAGTGLFVDLLINIYGLTKGINLAHEPQMPLVCKDFHISKGFILSPYLASGRAGLFLDLGPISLTLPRHQLIGLMVKTSDDPIGKVYPDGSFSVPLIYGNKRRLEEGEKIARQILIEAGAHPNSLITSHPSGAHPGGTAAIGSVVDHELQTKIDNLFVCDASVLPCSPGLPPIIILLAIGKWLAKRVVH
jgi:choline dehydrogenase-like flavoprotein